MVSLVPGCKGSLWWPVWTQPVSVSEGFADKRQLKVLNKNKLNIVCNNVYIDVKIEER